MFRLNNFFLIAVVLFLPVTVAGWDEADWNNAYNIGSAAGTSFSEKNDKPEEINSHFIQPLTSDETPMQTIDGSVSFNSQLSAPSSNAFLEVMVVPAGTGDLTTTILRQDTNFDSIPNYIYNVPVRISGICSNGFISANAGSWNNLRYYKWETNVAGEVIAAEQTSIRDLTACYCVNTSCGSNLVWTNIDIVLRDIGTGIVNAIHQTNSNYTITDVDVADTTITYYGQDSRNMGAANEVYAGGTTHPEVYINVPEDMNTDGETEFNNQMGDSDSYAFLVSSASDETANSIDCIIWNDIQFNQNVFTISNNGIDTWGTDHYLYMRIIQQNNEIFYQWLNTGKHGTICGRGCGPCYWDTTGLFDLNAILYPDPASYSYTFSAQMSGLGCEDSNAIVNTLDTNIYLGVCAGSNCQTPLVNWTYSLSGTSDEPQLVSNNSCASEDLDDCSLMEEKICGRGGVNCVYTIKDFNPTGFTPHPFCETVSTSIDFYTVCMDGSTSATIVNSSNVLTVLSSENNLWWHVKRTYSCENSDTFNLNAAEEQLDQISTSFANNDSVLSYQGIDIDTGEITSYSIGLPPGVDLEPCEKTCKIRVPIQNTQVAESGHTSQYQISTDAFNEIFRRCWNDVCTVNAGETLIQDCACIDQFAETASLMQALDEAGSDIICSE